MLQVAHQSVVKITAFILNNKMNVRNLKLVPELSRDILSDDVGAFRSGPRFVIE